MRLKNSQQNVRASYIGHLRDELAEEKRERRETQTKLTALLTDQRKAAPVSQPTTEKKPTNYALWAGVIGLFGVVLWLMLGQGG